MGSEMCIRDSNNPISNLSTEGFVEATPIIPHINYFFLFKFTCFPLATANLPLGTFLVITEPAPV